MQQMFYSSIITMPYSLSDKKIQPKGGKKIFQVQLEEGSAPSWSAQQTVAL